MSEADEDLDTGKFHENGILVMGLIGGFAFTALTLVLTQASAFENAMSNLAISLGGDANQALFVSEAYIAVLLALLGTLSSWSLVISFVMVLVSVTRRPDEAMPEFSGVAEKSLGFISGFFRWVTWLLIFPFSIVASLAFIIAGEILWRWVDRAFNRDMARAKKETSS